MQGQKHQFGIEARTGLDRSLDSPFDCGSKPSIVGMRESVATEHAVSDDFCRGTVEVWRRFAVLDVLPQQADGGELDGLRHKIGGADRPSEVLCRTCAARATVRTGQTGQAKVQAAS